MQKAEQQFDNPFYLDDKPFTVINYLDTFNSNMVFDQKYQNIGYIESRERSQLQKFDLNTLKILRTVPVDSDLCYCWSVNLMDVDELLWCVFSKDRIRIYNRKLQTLAELDGLKGSGNKTVIQLEKSNHIAIAQHQNQTILLVKRQDIRCLLHENKGKVAIVKAQTVINSHKDIPYALGGYDNILFFAREKNQVSYFLIEQNLCLQAELEGEIKDIQQVQCTAKALVVLDEEAYYVFRYQIQDERATFQPIGKFGYISEGQSYQWNCIAMRLNPITDILYITHWGKRDYQGVHLKDPDSIKQTPLFKNEESMEEDELKYAIGWTFQNKGALSCLVAGNNSNSHAWIFRNYGIN